MTQPHGRISDASPGSLQELAAAGSEPFLDQPPALAPLLGAALSEGTAAAPKSQSSLSTYEMLGPQPLSSATGHSSTIRHIIAAFTLAMRGRILL